MVWLILGALLLVAFMIFGRAFTAADPKLMANIIRLGAPLVLFLVSIVLSAGISLAVGLPFLFLMFFWPLILKLFGGKIGLQGQADGRSDGQTGQGYGRSGNPYGSRSTMTTKEALAILGLESNASRDEILQAHKALMKKVHPDQGGSDYLAQKINEAKDVLIGPK